MSASPAAPAGRAAMTAAERRADRKANPPLSIITLTVMLGLIMPIIDASIVSHRRQLQLAAGLLHRHSESSSCSRRPLVLLLNWRKTAAPGSAVAADAK